MWSVAARAFGVVSLAAVSGLVVGAGPAGGHELRHQSSLTAETYHQGTGCGPTYSLPPWVRCSVDAPYYFGGEISVGPWPGPTPPRGSRRCLVEREVSIFRVLGGEAEKVATVVSNGTRHGGFFSVAFEGEGPAGTDAPDGEFYASLAKLRGKSGRHKHVCSAALSERAGF